MEKKRNVKKMAQMALLTSIVLILAFTPLGYLKTPWGVEITFIVIPVAVGSVLLGPKAGAFLGFVFGMTSFFQCFGANPLGAMMLQLNPLGTFFCCVITRIMVGIVPGLIYRVFKRMKKAKFLGLGVSCLLAPVTNTVLYILSNFLIFSDTWLDIAITSGYTGEGGISLLGFLMGMVAVNGIAEAISCLLIGTAICKALQKVVG